jgi:hypothetical protein
LFDVSDEAERAACEQLEALPEEQVAEYFDAALRELQAQGIELDTSFWNDPDKFARYIEEFQRATGCDELPATEAQLAEFGEARHALHEGGSATYCGPSHGNVLVETVAGNVVPCLDEACMVHDACYAQCSEDVGTRCAWSDGAAPCDEAFFRSVDQCSFRGYGFVAWLNSHAVAALARGLNALPGECELTCPGYGPCRVDRQGTTCTQCIETADPAGECFSLVQSHPDFAPAPSDDAYLANCPTLAQCFGGYGLGASTGTSPTDPGSRWDLIVLSAVIPSSNVGDGWDGDGSAPDPFVGVVVGSEEQPMVYSAIADDTYLPTWDPGVPVSSDVQAGALKSYFSVTLYDEDLQLHDPIGTCAFTIADADFGQVFERTCPPTDTRAGFTVSFYLPPALPN